MTYHPFQILGEARPSRWLVTCDHAANTVPDFVGGGTLGLPQADMDRHIAYDVGAAGVTAALAEALDAPAILSNFSRLVIDPNRGEDDPTLLMKLYDGTIIPANRHAGPEELERRLDACYRPYHRALAGLAGRRDDTVLLSIHSFTPQLRGRPPRPWQVGVLYGMDDRLAQVLLTRLRAEPDLCVGENEPYGGHLPGDAVETHAIRHGRPNVLIELRNDLIATEAGQQAWATRLAPILQEALTASAL
ncbi:N-formylglutamate amidohydrolase [Pseudooceanicola sp. LIPI14-2-Ac024]|uniref:N-formylglutamate amidohydrolase n=1 Tax=Pseudooceanicola sp. LIPI14-2-Ac024 TaxID=3344875 RepID=UPI0035D0E0F2